MDSTVQRASGSNNAVAKETIPNCELNHADGRGSEKPASEMSVKEKVDQASPVNKFYESNGPMIKMVTLNNQFFTILDNNHIQLDQKSMNDMAELIMRNGYQDYVEITTKTGLWNQIRNRIKTVIMTCNNVKHNMAYVTYFFVSVFRKILEKSHIPDSQMELNLNIFIGTIRHYVKSIDEALWRNWFSCDGKFKDWITYVVYSVFVPKDRRVKSLVSTKVINNAFEYFEKVRYSRYIAIDDKPTEKPAAPAETLHDCISKCGENNKKRKHDDNDRVENENVTRSQVTSNKKSAIIQASRKRLRRL